MIDSEEGSPWYKQFWGWFVFMPLFVVIVASLSFVYTAFKHADDVVVDDYYKEGRMINQHFELDKQALALGLKGELRVDQELGEIFVDLSAQGDLPETLALYLNHPVQAEYDLQLTLREVVAGRYRADLEQPLQHRWYFRLQASEKLPATQAWRLKGTLDFQQGNSVLLGQ